MTEIITGRTCGTCNAFMKTEKNGDGICRALPPTPLFCGLRQRMGGVDPEPVVLAYHPPQSPGNWCRQWQQRLAS